MMARRVDVNFFKILSLSFNFAAEMSASDRARPGHSKQWLTSSRMKSLLNLFEGF